LDLTACTADDLFRLAKAMKQGHFLVSSGHHTSVYYEKALLLGCPQTAGEIVQRLAAKGKECAPDIVIGPAMGGALLAFGVALRLECQSAFFDKTHQNNLEIRRGYSFSRGERVLIVDDVLATGQSLSDIEHWVDQASLNCLGSVVILDRTRCTPAEDLVTLKYPVISLQRVSTPPNYPPNACPMCNAGIVLEVSKAQTPSIV
jgi:orotate phosphoribosyltransferase